MIDPKRLVCVGSKELLKAAGAMLRPPCAAYVDRERGVVVQVWDDATPGCIGTPWEGTLRVSIKHTRAKSIERIMARGYALPITWDDMQAIKDHFWPERIGIEIRKRTGYMLETASYVQSAAWRLACWCDTCLQVTSSLLVATRCTNS